MPNIEHEHIPHSTPTLDASIEAPRIETQENKRVGDAQARATKLASTYGELVALLSRSPVYRHMSLGDLEWLAIPPLMTNQVSMVRGKVKDQNGLTIPLGLAMWAHVSEEVDKKLEEQKQANIPFRLAPKDWKSGEIPWLLAVVAPKEAGLALVKKLEDSVFQGKELKRFPTAMLGGANRSQSGKNVATEQTNATSGVTLP